MHTNRPITQTASLPASGSEADVAKAIVKHIEVSICVYIHLTLYNFIIYIFIVIYFITERGNGYTRGIG